MKKIIGGLLLVFIAFVVIFGPSTYNRLVPLEENVNLSWAKYQSSLQKQADLIPNLASVAKGYMTSEQKTMIDTASARSGELSKIKASDIANNPELQKKLLEAQTSQQKAIATLTSVVEQYPNLKANEQVKMLMISMTNVQNEVRQMRNQNQNTVKEYNLAYRHFPGMIIARVVGFTQKPYFETSSENQNAPKINF